ncbi:acyltransferase family protein [Legionella sp. km772]|uniref:acyltransferase family protein n=1 Tax=Legionella sp. km772 TaxID=2498111 RepID=UPI000F8C48DF|nr:heparan-alpha-glucosaminide N-acetyltransferase domain-containing protein [Legionella sp. km772]RUR12496.1 DUF1624 domain-containing protein [Legionella sp. km772]
MTPISKRILSLDVFRGLIIVLMIIVNSQNTLAYPLLLHADWNGFTLADLVFPAFLFIVGLTAVISLQRHLGLEKKGNVYKSVIKRSLIMFFLGLLLAVFPWNIHLETFRFYGILQRIAVCYLLSSLIFLNSSLKTQIGIFLFIIIAYWYLMTQVAVPLGGVNQLTPAGSWVAYMDQLFFSPNHLLNKTYDPEGFLSTFPALATTLLGMFAGHILIGEQENKLKNFYLLCVLGLIMMLGGYWWNIYFPINKSLWSSSYVLWSGGISLLIFAACFLVIDIMDYQRWALPFKIFGMNALFAFIVHVLFLKAQFKIKFIYKGSETNLKDIITQFLFNDFSPENAVLLYALSFLLLNFLIVFFLYKRKIFIRI